LVLSKKCLSHLTDPKHPAAELLPFELYINDLQEEVDQLQEEIQRRQEAGAAPLRAEVLVQLEGAAERVEADVVGYDEGLRKFRIHLQKEGGGIISKLAGRLNMAFLDREGLESVEQRYRDAKGRQAEALMEGATDKIVIRELIHRYNHLGMERHQRTRIRKKLWPVFKQDWLQDGRLTQLKKDLVAQVESLHVHAVAKSLVMARQEDPVIRELLAGVGLKDLRAPSVADERYHFEKPWELRHCQARAD